MTANDIIILACQHMGKATMLSSARLCIDDAIALAGRDELESAKRRALKSLGYSVGIGHPDYIRAAQFVSRDGVDRPSPVNCGF